MFKIIKSTNEQEIEQELSNLKKSAKIENIYFSASVGATTFYYALVELKESKTVKKKASSGRKTTKSKL